MRKKLENTDVAKRKEHIIYIYKLCGLYFCVGKTLKKMFSSYFSSPLLYTCGVTYSGKK